MRTTPSAKERGIITRRVTRMDLPKSSWEAARKSGRGGRPIGDKVAAGSEIIGHLAIAGCIADEPLTEDAEQVGEAQKNSESEQRCCCFTAGEGREDGWHEGFLWSEIRAALANGPGFEGFGEGLRFSRERWRLPELPW